MTELNIVVLAAGQGKRMRSSVPKVLHPLAGRALLARVLDTARALNPQRICVVYGHGGEQVRDAQDAPDLRWALQEPQLGTGHAVLQAMPAITGGKRIEAQASGDSGPDFAPPSSGAVETESDTDARVSSGLGFAQPRPGVGREAVLHANSDAVPPAPTFAGSLTLILYGDVPLTRIASLQRLLAVAGPDRLALLTAVVPDPAGYGRIVRVDGKVTRIVEQKDADETERAIREINTGILVAPTAALARWLPTLGNLNAQGEYYLTDIVAMAVAEGMCVATAHPDAAWETEGVNSKSQLAQLERIHQRNQAEELMDAGVMLADPARIDIRGTLTSGKDVEIDVNCVFEGKVVLGDGVHVGANCVLRNCRIESGARIHPFCHIEDAAVGADSLIGPYARLRPGTQLGRAVHIGNFVEIKNTQVADASKANHLAYIGDATIGSRVNIGAGTITCNYDGVNKFRTVIEDEAFIGSDSQLVAPVTVGRGATLGAGTTLTKDAPANMLTISRAKQLTITGWKRPTKQKKD